MRKYKEINYKDLKNVFNFYKTSDKVNSFCQYMEIDIQDYGNVVKEAIDDGIENFELVAMVYDKFIEDLAGNYY